MRAIYHTANRKPRIERSQIARMNNQLFLAYSSSLLQRHIESTILLPKLLGYATLVSFGAFAEPLIENLSNFSGTRTQSLAYTMALSIAPKFMNKMNSEGYKAEDINNFIFELGIKEFTSDELTKAFLKLLLNRYYGTILI